MTPQLRETIVTALTDPGWCVAPNAFAVETTTQLAAETKQLWEQHALHAARVGRGAVPQTHPAIRGDLIHWLDSDSLSAPQRIYWDAMEQLRSAINQSLFLGLFDLEAHLALYPAGAYYRKHIDRFRDTSDRVVSCILYLNEAWKESEGGQLRIYTDPGDEHKFVDVPPRAGTLVTFLSANFPHEVLPATRTRMSVTGWFRTRL